MGLIRPDAAWINRTHWLARRGLAFAHTLARPGPPLFIRRGAIATPTLQTSATAGHGLAGVGIRGPSGAYWGGNSAGNSFSLNLTQGTVLLQFQTSYNAADGAAHSFFSTGFDNYPAGPIFDVLKFSDNNWYVGWIVGGTDSRVIAAATGHFSSFNPTTIAATWNQTTGLTGTRVYTNGILRASNATSPLTGNTAGGWFASGITRGGSIYPFFGSLGTVIYSLVVLDVALSAGEIAEFNSDPDGIFSLPPARRWATSGAASGEAGTGAAPSRLRRGPGPPGLQFPATLAYLAASGSVITVDFGAVVAFMSARQIDQINPASFTADRVADQGAATALLAVQQADNPSPVAGLATQRADYAADIAPLAARATDLSGPAAFAGSRQHDTPSPIAAAAALTADGVAPVGYAVDLTASHTAPNAALGGHGSDGLAPVAFSGALAVQTDMAGPVSFASSLAFDVPGPVGYAASLAFGMAAPISFSGTVLTDGSFPSESLAALSISFTQPLAYSAAGVLPFLRPPTGRLVTFSADRRLVVFPPDRRVVVFPEERRLILFPKDN